MCPCVDRLFRFVLFIEDNPQVRPCSGVAGLNSKTFAPLFFRRDPVAAPFIILRKFIMLTRVCATIACRRGLRLNRSCESQKRQQTNEYVPVHDFENYIQAGWL